MYLKHLITSKASLKRGDMLSIDFIAAKESMNSDLISHEPLRTTFLYTGSILQNLQLRLDSKCIATRTSLQMMGAKYLSRKRNLSHTIRRIKLC